MTANIGSDGRTVSQKQLANYLGLSAATVSIVLNGAPKAADIPETTKRRIFEAARSLNYHPNVMARSLRAKRSYLIGVLVPELSDGYSSAVLSGIEEFLMSIGYFYIVASHRHKPELLARYPHMLFARCVEGLIAVDTVCSDDLPLPTVSVSGHKSISGITNVLLRHQRAAELALRHLIDLGHRRIAFIRGQPFSSDSAVRWKSIQVAAAGMQLEIDPQLVVQLNADSPRPDVGYEAAKKLLATSTPFTALFSWNDVSAIGAMQAIRQAGYRVPEDISVIGFDDITAASFHQPALTTIRQPLLDMGRIAARVLMNRIDNPTNSHPARVEVDPELIVRSSTARAISK